MKNPYTFVNKANSTFNLYLEKFSEFEQFMEESRVEQEKTIKLIYDFMEESRVEQEKTNKLIYDFKKEYYSNIQDQKKDIIDEFHDEFKNMSEEMDVNNESIKELNSSLSNMKDLNEFNHEKTLNLIKKNDMKFNKLLNQNQNKIKNSIDSSNLLINDNFNHLDSSLRGHVDGVVDGLDSSLRGHVDGVVDGLDSSIELLIKNNKNLKDLSNNQINSLNDFIENQKFYNKKTNSAVNLFNSMYDDCKNYYFNNQVPQLNEYFNTGELFRLGYINKIQYISYSPAENKILLKSPEGIVFVTNNRFYTLKEVIGFNGYSIPQLYQFEDFVVFDIGMNRAYASLWFANFENCSHVYGFEIDDSTFEKAIENIDLNPHLSTKITPFNLGLSNIDETVDLYYLSGCDGVSTIFSEFTDIQIELKRNKDDLQMKNVEVKKASEVISKIITENNINTKIILKIDVEGAEYDIMDDLITSEIINKIDVILGEGHVLSDRVFVEDLSSFGFKQIKFNVDEFTYEFAFVKEEYFSAWPLKQEK